MTVTAPFHETVHAGHSIRTNFSGALAVAIYASTNHGQEIYSVFLNNEMSQICSGSTFWLVPDTVIFFQSSLEPMTVYAANIINMSGGGKLSLSSVVAYRENQPTNTGDTPGVFRIECATRAPRAAYLDTSIYFVRRMAPEFYFCGAPIFPEPPKRHPPGDLCRAIQLRHIQYLVKLTSTTP
ncbi:hypothetical protein B0H13DRAFT_1902759 [Mycena leptocephala]|nr:hypothetical protein B0H13DRAFT_1902759 [Mycena leptocephala]